MACIKNTHISWHFIAPRPASSKLAVRLAARYLPPNGDKLTTGVLV